MDKVDLVSASARAGAIFEEPFLGWSPAIPTRFFKALYTTLNDEVSIQPTDLVGTSGNSLGDYSATLKIYGGSDTITLRPNGVLVDFPTITPDRINFADDIMLKAYNGFLGEFAEVKVTSVEANSSWHLRLGDGDQLSRILDLGTHPDLRVKSEAYSGHTLQPAIRFSLVDDNGVWSARATIERSVLTDANLFILREFALHDTSEFGVPEEQFELVRRIDNMILGKIGLNLENSVKSHE
ncbi:MAG: hypothetical protein AAF563_05595 [Pseudomonadota bacterium]